jgi:hypothetical protein
MKARKCFDARADGLPRWRGIEQDTAIRMCREHDGLSPVQKRIAVTRWNSDASLRVERDDRGSVTRFFHPSFTTFFYLSPL